MSIDVTLIEVLLAVAIVGMVPAAVPLHPAGNGKAAAAGAVLGVPAAVALLTEPGAVAAALVVPWLAASGLGIVAAGRWWWPRRRRLRAAVWAAAAVYLGIAAGWLLADRAGLQPAGITPPFVQLTAVHFHYAGFLATTIACCVWRHRPRDRTAATAGVLTVAGPPVVAVGFVAYGALQIAGAVLLTAGLWLLGWVTVRRVVPAVVGAAAWLLAVSSLAMLVPMVLAVQWAIGNNYATPALSIPAMARIHGTVNALGFVLPAIVGWRLLTPPVGRDVPWQPTRDGPGPHPTRRPDDAATH